MRSAKLYLLGATGLAGCAFALGQVLPGAGTMLVIGVTTIWVAVSTQRSRRGVR